MKLKPLFKWTGGKNRMREKYSPFFYPEKSFDKFIDCFYGAGAVTHWVLETTPNAEFIINDFNAELIQLYKTLASSTDDFIEQAVGLQKDYLSINDKDKRKEFYNIQKMKHINDYMSMSDVEVAAGLYFMMRINFNGWWKIYNYSNGRYATPPGVMGEKNNFIDVENLKNTGQFFKEQCTILNGDFEVVRPFVTNNSFVYFDPPYRDSTTIYTEDGFGDSDQIRLCNFFEECVNKGAIASLSNKEIGDGFFEQHLGRHNLHKMPVKYTAGRGTTTNNVMEILVTSYVPKQKTSNITSFF